MRSADFCSASGYPPRTLSAGNTSTATCGIPRASKLSPFGLRMTWLVHADSQRGGQRFVQDARHITTGPLPHAESGGRQCFKKPRHAVSTARIAAAAGCAVRVELQRRGTVHIQPHEVIEAIEPSVAAGVGQGSALHPRKSVHD